MKLKYFIDSHKGLTFLAVFLLIAFYNQWDNATAWVYMALHGTYGLLWILKSQLFPDRNWEAPASPLMGLVIWGALSLYWVTPWLITSQAIQAPGWYLALCISLYTFGVFFHFISDMQKYVALKLRPNELITEGVWRWVRNPNYFGELLIYSGFSLLAMHWLPFVALALFIGAVWIPQMLKKEKSLARYPEFSHYKAHSKIIIPFII